MTKDSKQYLAIGAAVFSLVFTVGGTLYSVKNDQPVIMILFLISLLLTLGIIFYNLRESTLSAETKLAAEQSRRETAEHKLANLSTELFDAITIPLAHYRQDAVLKQVRVWADYIHRMIQLTAMGATEIIITHFFDQSEIIYVVAKPDTNFKAISQTLHIHDPFYLFHRAEGGLDSQIALVHLHQINETELTLFFRLIVFRDGKHIDALRTHIGKFGAKLPEGYSLRPCIEASGLANRTIDLSNLDWLLSTIMPLLDTMER